MGMHKIRDLGFFFFFLLSSFLHHIGVRELAMWESMK